MGTYDGKPKRGLLHTLRLLVSRTAVPLLPFLALMLLLLLAGMSMRESSVVTRLTPYVTKTKGKDITSSSARGTLGHKEKSSLMLSRKLPESRASIKQQKDEHTQQEHRQPPQEREREDERETSNDDLLEYNEDIKLVNADIDATQRAASPSSSSSSSSSLTVAPAEEATQRSPYGYIDLMRNRTSQYLSLADVPLEVHALSWDTRVLHVKGLLTLEEREHAIARSNDSSYGPMVSHGVAGKAHRSRYQAETSCTIILFPVCCL